MSWNYAETRTYIKIHSFEARLDTNGGAAQRKNQNAFIVPGAARSALELHGMEARFLLPVLYHGFCCRVTKGQFIMRWLTTSFLNQYRRDRSEGEGKNFFRNR